MKHFVFIGVVALLLSACGSGGSGSGAGSTGSSTENNSVMDAFTAYVASLVGSASDNSEPVAVDSVNVTTSESAEASPVM
ncbi:MAG: hypothetical protein HYS18_14760 [Burkholderiales bacterium]|nr:hypothetical protein [Burkholderiales bacterium]